LVFFASCCNIDSSLQSLDEQKQTRSLRILVDFCSWKRDLDSQAVVLDEFSIHKNPLLHSLCIHCPMIILSPSTVLFLEIWKATRTSAEERLLDGKGTAGSRKGPGRG
jgi:hypothetical protein